MQDLGKGPTHDLDNTTLTAGKKDSINFTVTRNKFCLNLHYNGANSCLFVNGTQINRFIAKDSEIKAIPLCLEKFSEDPCVGDTKKTGFYEYVHDYSVDYDALLDILKYLMKKSGIV